jgi:hypothetical protein
MSIQPRTSTQLTVRPGARVAGRRGGDRSSRRGLRARRPTPSTAVGAAGGSVRWRAHTRSEAGGSGGVCVATVGGHEFPHEEARRQPIITREDKGVVDK